MSERNPPPARSEENRPVTRVSLVFESFRHFLDEYSSHISMGGMFIGARRPLPPGSLCQLEFRLRDGYPLILGRGEVVWTRARDEGPGRPPGMGVRFREISTPFQTSGGCGTVDGKKGLSCGIDCDGGEIDVTVRDQDSILVSIPDGARTWDPESGETPPANARFGLDDKLFRLDRTKLQDCLPLVGDDSLKAEISAAK